MDFDIRQMKKRIVESQLFDQSACDVLVNNFFESESNGENLNPENLVHWLCEQKSISAFQADILLTEPEPRLQYGNYQLIDRVDEALGVFHGRHTLTLHPVRMQFFCGSDSAALQRWQKGTAICNHLADFPHPNVLEHYEPVAITEYRFVTTAVPHGIKISELIPLKARVPADKAHHIILQIAKGLNHLFAMDPDLDLQLEDSVRVSKSGDVQLIPCINLTPIPQPPSLHQLANLWYRLTSGRLPKTDGKSKKLSKEELIRLKKYGFDVELIRLLNQAHNATGNSMDIIGALIKKLQPFERKSIQSNVSKETQAAYQDWLQIIPGIETDLRLAEENPDIETDDKPQDPVDFGDTESLDLESPHSADAEIKPRRNSMLAPLLGSMLILGAILAVVIVITQNVSIQTRVADRADTDNNNQTDPGSSASENPEPVDPDNDAGPLAEPIETPWINQILIKDNQVALWESPTSGKPIDFISVPGAPKIAISLRLSELLQTDSGQMLLKAFGPGIESQLNQLEQLISFPLAEIKQLLITFHSNANFEYESVYHIWLQTDQTKEQLIAKWGTEPRLFEEEFEYHHRNEQECFGIFNTPDNNFSHFVFGPESLIAESVSYSQVDTTTGSMARLVAASDGNRHMTFLALRSGLFNDEGQKLMGADQLDLNQQMSRAISSVVRGLSISIHLDRGTFIEAGFDQSVDLTPDLLKTNLQRVITRTGQQLDEYTRSMSSNPYWDRLRERIGQILDDFQANFRFGIENGNVVSNGWFPQAAAHNWIVATRLTLTYGRSQYVAQIADATTARKIPQSLSELLAVPRDLSVSTSPDLIILMNNLQQEIKDEYGALPFDFEIKLMGADLSKEGITQNQRPSDLEMKQQPLSSILTEIMVKANPDKNITGANDVNCKMIWVIAADPEDPDREIILITTRAAAEANAYTLPAAFVPTD